MSKNKKQPPIRTTSTPQRVSHAISKPAKPQKTPFFGGATNFSAITSSIPTRILAFFRHLFVSSFSSLKYPKLAFSATNSGGFRALFVVLVGLSLILMPVLSFDYGLTWDEKIQRDYAKDIIEYYESGRKDTSLFDQSKHLYNTMLFYGCSFDVLTNYTHDKLFPKTDEFELRHVFNALFGTIMMLYTALIAKYLGGWRTACIAYVFCLLSPSIFGHSMNNPKDIPFACSYIFAIYFMIRFLNRLPLPRLKDLLLIGVGIGWTISTRAGGIMLIAFFGLFLAIAWLQLIRTKSIKAGFLSIPKFAFYFSIAGLVGYFLGQIMWPYAQKDPIYNPFKALKSLTNVNYLHTYENFDGLRIYMSQVPWPYIGKWILIGSPLFILIGVLITLILAKGISRKYNYYFISLLLFIFIFPIVYIIYKNSTVYNGWRHFIFVYLSLVVIAAIGWEYVIFYLSQNKWVRMTSLAILLLLGGKVCFWMIKNHPNQYIYFNELIGGTAGAKGNYEMDYYSNTTKQAVEWLVKNEKLQHKNVKLVTNNELLTVSNYTTKLADSIQILWTRDYERYKQEWDYAIFTTRTFSPSQLKNGHFPPKGTIKTIDVDGVPVCAVVKRPNKVISKGFALSSKMKYAEALPYYEEAIALDNTDEEAYRMASLCLLNLGEDEKAKSYLDKSIALNPEGFMPQYLMAFYYIGKKDTEKAEKYLKESIKNRINNGDAHAELANIYLERGLYAMAMSSYMKAVEFGNNNPRTYTNLAVCYVNVQDYETAISYLNLALNKDPNYLPAFESLAVCFERLGDMETVAQIRQRIRMLSGS